MLVVHTREGHRPDLADLPPAKRVRGRFATGIGDPGPMGRILVRGEAGHDIVPELAPLPGEPVIDKPGKGAFYATDFESILRHHGIARLIVCGVTTEVCVNTTVREANDRGYDCLVVEDCVGSYFPAFQEMGLAMIKAQGGIFGWVGSSAIADRRRSEMAEVREFTGPRLWVPGDWNGFFGLFTNVVLNVIVLSGLCLGVVKIPPDTVFGRILPALGIALPLGNLFYAWLAWQLAKKEGAQHASPRCPTGRAFRTCSSSCS